MKTKCAVASTLISLVFVSQAFPVLRPLFPIKPSAPSNGELIVIGDELVLRSDKKPCYITGASHSSQCLDSTLWPSPRGRSLAPATISQRSPRARRCVDRNARVEWRRRRALNRFGVARFVLDLACHRTYKALS